MPSIASTIADAVTPEPSSEDRAEAREKARQAARPGDWLSLVIDQHVEIEDAFKRAKAASGGDNRSAACKRLALVLMGHSIAEEAVLYPAMAEEGESGVSHAYDEQVMAKKEMAKLEKLPPSSQHWLDKLEKIRSAVFTHIYNEEGTWFAKLHKDAKAEEGRLTRRFKEEYERYTHEEAEPHRAAAE